MSVLHLPRIVLNGTTKWNPATNNNALQFGYNKDLVELNFHLPPDPDFPNGVNAKNFDKWLTNFNTNTNTTNGDWNVFGQMQAWFEAKVTGTKVVDPKGHDPLVGGALQFTNGTPKLVDTNAYSSVTSQVFLQDFAVEAADGVGFSGPATSRMYSRRPFFGRNTAGQSAMPIAGGMGVVWQTTIAAGQIQWGANADNSQVLGQLKAAMEQKGVQGIMLRVSSYLTLYFTDVIEGGLTGDNQVDAYKALAHKYNANSPIVVGNIASTFNPALSQLTGAIGLWTDGELATVPSGRVLAAAGSLGPAEALLNQNQGLVSLDLTNTVPETDRTGTKANVGTLSVVGQATDGTPIPIGKIAASDYDQAAYRASGGIVDLPFSGNWTDLDAAKISIIPESAPSAPLEELSYYADTDGRGVYLDEGDAKTIKVQVFEKGCAPTGDMMVLAQSTDESAVALTGGTVEGSARSYKVGSDGTAEVGVSPVQPGNAIIAFLAYPAGGTVPSFPSNLPEPTTGYATVRVMPFDDQLGNTPQGEITWQLVYDKVLSTFDLAYRGMSAGVFDIGNEQSVNANGSAIIQFSDPDEFESPLYMPITRDMSRGRRKLLVRYLRPGSDLTS